MNKVNLKKKFDLFDEVWTPKIVGELNGQYVKLAKTKGEIVRHRHDKEDEFFMVISGELVIKMNDEEVHLRAGEFLIVPKGVEHKPVSENGAEIMLFEPKGTKHTGDVKSEMTVEELDWI